MRFFLAICVLLCFSAESYSQKVIKLDEAIKIAVEKNTLLQKQNNTLESYKSNINASFGKFLPTLGAQAGWEWTRSEQEGGQKYIQNVGVIPVNKTVVVDNRQYTVGAGTNWTLFDGLSNFNTHDQNKINYKAAELSIQRLKQDVVFQTISLYYNIVNYQTLLKVKEEDLVWNKKNLETVNAKNQLGAVTMADVYSQQVKLGNAELEFIKTKNNLETAKLDLLNYLSLDAFGSYSFPDTLSFLNGLNLQEDNETVKSLVDEAIKHRPDYQSAKLNILSASKGIDIAKGNYYPQLTNNINFYSSSDMVKNLFKSNTYSVGLTLSIPIFEGFSIDNQVQSAVVSYKNKQIELTELEKDIKKKIQQTYLDLLTAQKSVDVSKRNVTSAEENRKIEEEKYSLGSGTLLNVLIANSEYNNAQTSLINTMFSYSVLKEQLNYYLGIIDFKKFE